MADGSSVASASLRTSSSTRVILSSRSQYRCAGTGTEMAISAPEPPRMAMAAEQIPRVASSRL